MTPPLKSYFGPCGPKKLLQYGKMTAMATFISELFSNIYPKMLSFRVNRKKAILRLRVAKNQFFVIFSKTKHFKAYVAS